MEIKGLISSIGTTLRFLFSPTCPMWLQTGRLATGNWQLVFSTVCFVCLLCALCGCKLADWQLGDWATGTSVFYRVLCMCPIVPYVVPAFYLLLFSIVSYVPYVVATFYLLPSTFYLLLFSIVSYVAYCGCNLLPSTFYLLPSIDSYVPYVVATLYFFVSFAH
jgi:hypothetical protein